MTQRPNRIWRKAYDGFGAWRKAYVGFGAKHFRALPLTGCRTTEVVIGAICTAGRQTNGGGVCMGLVEVCVGDGGGVCRGGLGV